MRDFERDRANLSHDRFKNQFLVSIAFSPENQDEEDRYIKFREALQGDQTRWGQIENAFNDWPDLCQSIEDFLNKMESRYGFVLSNTFINKRKEIFEHLSRISNFISRFPERKIAEEDIRDFWIAADKLREFLWQLGHDRKRYILDFDPALLAEQ